MADSEAQLNAESEAQARKDQDSGEEDNSIGSSTTTATPTPTSFNPAAAASSGTNKKVDLLLKATSDVPIMKKKKWQVDESKTVHWIISFIKKYLKLDENETIFLYVSQAFAPSPDQKVKNLYECFGTDGKLVLHYSKTPAWG